MASWISPRACRSTMSLVSVGSSPIDIQSHKREREREREREISVFYQPKWTSSFGRVYEFTLAAAPKSEAIALDSRVRVCDDIGGTRLRAERAGVLGIVLFAI